MDALAEGAGDRSPERPVEHRPPAPARKVIHPSALSSPPLRGLSLPLLLAAHQGQDGVPNRLLGLLHLPRGLLGQCLLLADVPDEAVSLLNRTPVAHPLRIQGLALLCQAGSVVVHGPTGKLHLLHAILKLGQKNLVVPGQHPHDMDGLEGLEGVPGGKKEVQLLGRPVFVHVDDPIPQPVEELVHLDLLPRHLRVQKGDILLNTVPLKLQHRKFLTGDGLILLQLIDAPQKRLDLGVQLFDPGMIVADALFQLLASLLLSGDPCIQLRNARRTGRERDAGHPRRQQTPKEQTRPRTQGIVLGSTRGLWPSA